MSTEMYKFLLINPWIYDFAAVNMWSRPLGLMKVAEYLSQFNVKLRLIDCMDIIKKQKLFGMAKYPKTLLPTPEPLKEIRRHYGRYGMELDTFVERLRSIPRPDCIMVTGIMTYWYPGVFKAIELCKDLYPDVPVVLGGIYARLFPDHARKHSGADAVYTGVSGEGVKRVLEDMSIRLVQKGNVLPWYKLGFYSSSMYAPLLTSEGCPFRCTYCASGILWSDFAQRKPEEVLEEIEYLSSAGVTDFAFYDDALLSNRDSHIKPILEGIISRGIKVRFHTPNGLHVRFLDEEIAFLMRRAGFVTIRLSLETTDPERQRTTGGKVYNEEFQKAVKVLKKAGFGKENIGVYLMYGLPGQGLDEVEEGIRFLMSLDVKIHLAEFSPIPGTSAWNELLNKGVISEDIDPLLTNNTVFSLLYSGYNSSDIQRIKKMVSDYNRQ